MIRPLLPLLLLVTTLLGQAQDSTAVSRFTPGAVTGAVMAVMGTATRFSSPSKFNVSRRWEANDKAASVLQFVPLASVWALKGLGVPTRDSWAGMAVNQGISAALTAGMVYGLKGNINATRPSGENQRSWPSGHSAWAFMGATVVARELGVTSVWYPMGAYALATGVAASRVLQRQHLPADVMAGAGIGILATQVGYALGDLISGQPHEHMVVEGENKNFSDLSVAMGMALPLGSLPIPGGKLKRLPALTASLRAGLAVEDNWGIAFETGLISTPIIVDVSGDKEYASPQTAIGLMFAPYYRHAFSRRLSIVGEAGVGYYRNLDMKTVNDAVTSGNGSLAGRVQVGLSMRFSDHFGSRVSLGYQVSHYSFRVRPCEELRITQRSSLSGVASNLLVSFSSRYTF